MWLGNLYRWASVHTCLILKPYSIFALHITNLLCSWLNIEFSRNATTFQIEGRLCFPLMIFGTWPRIGQHFRKSHLYWEPRTWYLGHQFKTPMSARKIMVSLHTSEIIWHRYSGFWYNCYSKFTYWYKPSVLIICYVLFLSYITIRALDWFLEIP